MSLGVGAKQDVTPVVQRKATHLVVRRLAGKYVTLMKTTASPPTTHPCAIVDAGKLHSNYPVYRILSIRSETSLRSSSVDATFALQYVPLFIVHTTAFRCMSSTSCAQLGRGNRVCGVQNWHCAAEGSENLSQVPTARDASAASLHCSVCCRPLAGDQRP